MCKQGRFSQGCFPVVPKLSQSCHGVWLFANKADCLKVVSKLFLSYPKVVRGLVVYKQGRLSQGCLQVVLKLSLSCQGVRLFASKADCLKGNLKVVPKLSQSCHGVWLFASMAVSKLFQYFPKLTTGFGCLQARRIVSRLFPSFPKLSQNCHRDWLFASKADCFKALSE